MAERNWERRTRDKDKEEEEEGTDQEKESSLKKKVSCRGKMGSRMLVQG